MRNLQLPGRSPVLAKNGMAATSHPLSTLAAIDVLRDGGNAMDAAIAACAVQCVVEPQSTGIGGDCFMLYSEGGSGDIKAFNGSGRAPAKATPEWYAEQGITQIERQSAHAVTVPGAVEAWSRLSQDHGRKDLGALLQPAITHAREGYAISSRVAVDWKGQEDLLRNDPGARAIFQPDGHMPGYGDMHRQPELGDTLEAIAKNGPDAFYSGPVAEDILETLHGYGGVHEMSDFAEVHGDAVQPIQTTYKDNQVFECPPNGQGIIALEMLNILSGFDLEKLDPVSVERLHLQIEAARLAYRDRDDLVADPAAAQVPIAAMLSKEHAQELSRRIDAAKAMENVPPSSLPAHADTVYITVVDKDRNAVSFINSLYHAFGSGICAPRSGVMLHNRGQGFTLESGHPNCVAPRKRPLHTIIPGMMVKDGRAVMPFGVMGGHYQACGHAHLITNLLDHGMDVQEAIDCARVFPTQDGTVEIEDGVPAEITASLKKMGHDTVRAPRPHGGAQAIEIDWNRGVLRGGSECRKDGCALGY